QPALAAGTRLGARHVALLASLGMDSARVRSAPRISVFSTGDELRAPGMPLAKGQIHDSNGAMLAAQTGAAACTLARQGHLEDRPDEQLAALRQAAADSDIIVTAGGVSMGEADYLPRLLNAHGRIHFWRVRMKPGLPVLFGEMDNCLVVGLPGNPVSAAVGFHVLVRHLLQAIEAATPRPRLNARLRSGIRKHHWRAEFVRGRLHADAQAGLWFEAHAQQGSAQLLGLAASDCLALLDENMHDPEAGTVCRVWPLDGALA
ncbi:MAG: molybdopterin molybdotransferase MoeA, partial [Rhodanobacteraceae bacterium]